MLTLTPTKLTYHALAIIHQQTQPQLRITLNLINLTTKNKQGQIHTKKQIKNHLKSKYNLF